MSTTQDTPKSTRPLFGHFKRNVLAGILTIIPLWITWVIFTFVLSTFSNIGKPTLRALSETIGYYWPQAAEWINSSVFEGVLAVLITLAGLFFLGWMTNLVLGRRLLSFVDRVINRIPFAHTIYGASKKLIGALGGDSTSNIKRVVLIEFPSKGLKTVGFVTAIMNDQVTGEELATVYVPTTPNPTSGYLEIIPTRSIIETNWTFDEAMTFIISGGAVAPADMPFSGNPEQQP